MSGPPGVKTAFLRGRARGDGRFLLLAKTTLGGFRLLLLREGGALVELINPARRIDQLLLPREQRVTRRTNLNADGF